MERNYGKPRVKPEATASVQQRYHSTGGEIRTRECSHTDPVLWSNKLPGLQTLHIIAE